MNRTPSYVSSGSTSTDFSMRRDQLITVGDLAVFKKELLADLEKFFDAKKDDKIKKWIGSKEVASLLSISLTTLQTLRINGLIPYSRLGGRLYYNVEAVEGELKKKSSG